MSRPPLRLVKDVDHFIPVMLSVKEMDSVGLVIVTLFDILQRHNLGMAVDVAEDAYNVLQKFKNATKAALKETP